MKCSTCKVKSICFMEGSDSSRCREYVNVESKKIIVIVRGGVAYCDDKRVEIRDYDNVIYDAENEEEVLP